MSGDILHGFTAVNAAATRSNSSLLERSRPEFYGTSIRSLCCKIHARTLAADNRSVDVQVHQARTGKGATRAAGSDDKITVVLIARRKSSATSEYTILDAGHPAASPVQQPPFRTHPS
jgi:hypothetical protein